MNLFSLSDSQFFKNPLLLEQLLAPMANVHRNFTRSSRDCPGIPDADFLRLGFLRTLSQARSGRDFLQQQQEIWDKYRDYQTAVLLPGLSPEQRRLLFGAAVEQLALPLPAGVWMH